MLNSNVIAAAVTAAGALLLWALGQFALHLAKAKAAREERAKQAAEGGDSRERRTDNKIWELVDRLDAEIKELRAAAVEDRKRLDEHVRLVESLRGELWALRQGERSLKEEKAQVEAENARLREEVAALRAEVVTLRARVASLEHKADAP